MKIRRTALIAAAYLAFGIAVFAARPQATTGPPARDFEAYWSAGATFDKHADPYSASIWNDERNVPGVDARSEGLLPFVGPPATLFVWGLAARLPYAEAAPWWLLLLCCALGGLLLVSLRGARANVNAGIGFGAVALAISFGPITSDIALGQFAIVAAFGATLLVVAQGTLPATIGGVLAFAQPNAAPALISQLSRKRTLVAIAMAIALIYVLGAMVSGWGWIGAYAKLLAAHDGAERLSAIQITPAAIAFGFGASSRVALAIAVVVALAAIACAVVIAKRTTAFPRFAAFAALTPFVSSFWHEHDLVLAFPAVLWCALHAAPRMRAIALLGTLLVAIDWLGLAQRPSGIVQSALLAVAAWCAFNSLRSNALNPAIGYATAAGAIVFAGASALAIAHPVPVWPVAMHAIALPPGASVAQIWAAQQEATGLNRPVATWAILRALSLIGCALVAYSIYSRCPYYRTA